MAELTLVGATLGGGDVVVTERLEGSPLCGRWRASTSTGTHLIVTSGGEPLVPVEVLRGRLALAIDGVEALAHLGPVAREGVDVAWAMVEREPAGLPATTMAGQVGARALAEVGARLADVVAAAHARQLRLTALHPATVYLNVRGATLALSGVIPRALDFLALTRRPRPFALEILEPWFGAPERFAEAAEAASDVYDCALIIGFLATGQWPWGGSGTPRGEWLERALGATTRPYTGLPPAFADIEAAIAAALARSPAERPEAATLARWLRSMAT